MTAADVSRRNALFQLNDDRAILAFYQFFGMYAVSGIEFRIPEWVHDAPPFRSGGLQCTVLDIDHHHILAIACMVLGYRLHLRRIRDRFALVLEERARLSREIHDTLVQDFVGISSQLEGVSMSLNGDRSGARRHLDLAMRMARHSLTEAVVPSWICEPPLWTPKA